MEEAELLTRIADQAELESLVARIPELPEDQQRELFDLLQRIEKADSRKKSQTDFLAFVNKVWPQFIHGRHHKIMARAFERIASGKLKRVIISMPPRHTKSQFASWLLPAWFLGQFPDKKIIQTSHTAELAVHFGRQVRNLVASQEYQDIFPGVALAADAKASGHWSTNKNGEYFAIGVGGAIAGKGADLFIIDDPHSEQEAQLAAFKPEIFDNVYEWYTSGPRQRLQPGAAVVVVMTRWGQRDLVGNLLKKAAQKGEQDEWEVIELPAILPSGNALWPEYWSLEELLKVKADIPVSKWNAQYMQNPTSEEGAIVKREWWQMWPSEKPPQNIEFIIQTWDTAFSKSAKSNYSACSTWGIFKHEMTPGARAQNCIILLDAYKEKLEFPELKQKAFQLYKHWKPDAFIVEARVTGVPLIFELRNMGIPVSEFMPARGPRGVSNDKIARLNSVSDIFRSRLVFRPDTTWADEVVEELASFPFAESDDITDTVIMALMRYRQGGFVRLDVDEEEAEEKKKRRVYY